MVSLVLCSMVLSTIFVRFAQTLRLNVNLDRDGEGDADDLVSDRRAVEYLQDLIQLHTSLPAHLQNLIYRGSALERGRNLSDYNIEPNSTVWLESPILDAGFYCDAPLPKVGGKGGLGKVEKIGRDWPGPGSKS